MDGELVDRNGGFGVPMLLEVTGQIDFSRLRHHLSNMEVVGHIHQTV